MGLRHRRYAHLRRRVQFVLHLCTRLVVSARPRNRRRALADSRSGTGIGGESCAFIFPGCTWAAIGIGFGYSAQGPVSAANGVVYACSLNPVGSNMYAMDAATGQVKWSYASGASCLGGAAIANGTVYWGTGYRVFAPLTTGGNKLFAFTPNGN